MSSREIRGREETGDWQGFLPKFLLQKGSDLDSMSDRRHRSGDDSDTGDDYSRRDRRNSHPSPDDYQRKRQSSHHSSTGRTRSRSGARRSRTRSRSPVRDDDRPISPRSFRSYTRSPSVQPQQQRRRSVSVSPEPDSDGRPVYRDNNSRSRSPPDAADDFRSNQSYQEEDDRPSTRHARRSRSVTPPSRRSTRQRSPSPYDGGDDRDSPPRRRRSHEDRGRESRSPTKRRRQRRSGSRELFGNASQEQDSQEGYDDLRQYDRDTRQRRGDEEVRIISCLGYCVNNIHFSIV